MPPLDTHTHTHTLTLPYEGGTSSVHCLQINYNETVIYTCGMLEIDYQTVCDVCETRVCPYMGHKDWRESINQSRASQR